MMRTALAVALLVLLAYKLAELLAQSEAAS